MGDNPNAPELPEPITKTNTLALFDVATKAVRASDLIDKVDIEMFGVAAMRAINAALRENDILSAITVAEKTQAIENFLHFQMWHEKVAMSTVNQASKWRLKIVRKIGTWLAGHVEKHVPKQYAKGGVADTRSPSDVVTTPKVYLDEIGLDEHKSSEWQQIAAMDEDKFEEFTEPFLETKKGEKEKYLSESKVLAYLNPKPAKKEKNSAEQELDRDMKELKLPRQGRETYELLKKLKKSIDAYVDLLHKDERSYRHLVFMASVIRSVAKHLVEAAARMDVWAGELHDKSK